MVFSLLVNSCLAVRSHGCNCTDRDLFSLCKFTAPTRVRTAIRFLISYWQWLSWDKQPPGWDCTEFCYLNPNYAKSVGQNCTQRLISTIDCAITNLTCHAIDHFKMEVLVLRYKPKVPNFEPSPTHCAGNHSLPFPMLGQFKGVLHPI